MTRDHLMGYPPAASVSADCPDDYDDFPDFDHSDYPLGVPQRVRIDMRKRWEAAGCKTDTLGAFERMPHPNPDGTYTPKQPGRTFASKVTESFTTPGELNHVAPNAGLAGLAGAIYDVQNIEADGPVVQRSAWTYREGTPSVFDATKHAENPLTQRPWNQPAIPLSQLVPPGVMVGGESHITWLADGNHFFVNGREVSREEFHRAQAGAGRVKTPMRIDLLAQALKKANEDPSFRDRMTQRVKALNAELKQQGPSKGDGGIALGELTAVQAYQLQAFSMPVRLNFGFDTGFDFPPNA